MHGILKRVMQMAWPVMLSYVAVGMPCGVLAAQAGMTPLMCLVLSATFVSGSGQFMMNNLWLAGVPAPSIAASVAAISARFSLYAVSVSCLIKVKMKGLKRQLARGLSTHVRAVLRRLDFERVRLFLPA